MDFVIGAWLQETPEPELKRYFNGKPLVNVTRQENSGGEGGIRTHG